MKNYGIKIGDTVTTIHEDFWFNRDHNIEPEDKPLFKNKEDACEFFKRSNYDQEMYTGSDNEGNIYVFNNDHKLEFKGEVVEL